MTQRNGIKNSLKPAAVALLCLALPLPTLTPPEFEQEFDNNRILVVLDKRISKANKKLNKNFFSFLKDDESTNSYKFFPFRAALLLVILYIKNLFILPIFYTIIIL
jgi:hypothetical protein